MVAPDGTGEDLYKYVTIDADEVETQAAWEIDLEYSGRPALSDENLEYEVANWNFMYFPQ